jgi:hypothetical protein
MIIIKNGITIKLNSDEIQGLVKSPPRTIEVLLKFHLSVPLLQLCRPKAKVAFG